jgi:sulfur-carrier protein
MEIILFGQLADIVGNGKIDIASAADTDELKRILENRFPRLKGVNYMIAVNKQLVQSGVALHGGEVIALMPPFSGG